MILKSETVPSPFVRWVDLWKTNRLARTVSVSKKCVSSCNLLHLLRVSQSLVKGNAKQRNITGPVDGNGRKRTRRIRKERKKERKNKKKDSWQSILDLISYKSMFESRKNTAVRNAISTKFQTWWIRVTCVWPSRRVPLSNDFYPFFVGCAVLSSNSKRDRNSVALNIDGAATKRLPL